MIAGVDMWLGFVILGVFGGIALGWEKGFHGNSGDYHKTRHIGRIFGIFILGSSVASQVESFRGFWMVFLSTLGSYYISSHAGQFFEKTWSNFKRRRPNCDIFEELCRPKSRIFRINTRNFPPAYVETIFLRGAVEPHPIPTAAKCGNRELKIRADGWLHGVDISIEPNDSVEIAIEMENWTSVTGYRTIGRWANGVFWIIDGDMKS